jgi:hypothetical protein
MFAQIATTMGIRSICHSDCRQTRAELASLGLSAGEGVVRDKTQSTGRDGRSRRNDY